MALPHCFIKLALFSTLILSRFSSSPSQPPFPSPPPSSMNLLISRGYSQIATILYRASPATGALFHLNGWNASGILFAPSDSAFRNRLRRLPPHPSPSILLFHTARSPPLLYSDIAAFPAKSSFPTFSHRRRCIFLHQTPSGEPCIAETPQASPCFKIRDPDLFHDGNLVIHGIDAVLDPSIASPCAAPRHLASAVTGLRRKGYFAVAEALFARRDELDRLTGVTVFAPMDGGDLHVLPRRYNLYELARLTPGQPIRTIVPGRDIAVGLDGDGAVTVNGVSVDGDAIYRSKWAVILPVRRQIRTADSVNDGGGAGLGPSGGDLPECCNGGPTTEACKVDPIDNPLPEASCLTPRERHVAPCPVWRTAPSFHHAATPNSYLAPGADL